MATTENKEASLLASTYGVVEPGKDKVSTNVSSVTINDLSIEVKIGDFIKPVTIKF